MNGNENETTWAERRSPRPSALLCRLRENAGKGATRFRFHKSRSFRSVRGDNAAKGDHYPPTRSVRMTGREYIAGNGL